MEGFFEGRKLVIATMHRKEHILQPLLEAGLNVQIRVVKGLNTDLLGTFSGEVAREDDSLATARKKCELAMDLSGCDLAVASEGSFGPHPKAFFLPGNEEWLLLVDRKNKLEIHARHLSLSTNYGGIEFHSLAEVDAFAEKAGFPSHGLILRASKDGAAGLVKGITDPSLLHVQAQLLLDTQGQGYLETDMRALYNPTRMQVIQEAAEKLLQKLQSQCPSCQLPGFSLALTDPGLPCSLCGSPTPAPLAHHWVCQHCGHDTKIPFPQGNTEDPQYCQVCNP